MAGSSPSVGVFRLCHPNPPGLREVQRCRKTGFHPDHLRNGQEAGRCLRACLTRGVAHGEQRARGGLAAAVRARLPLMSEKRVSEVSDVSLLCVWTGVCKFEGRTRKLFPTHLNGETRSLCEFVELFRCLLLPTSHSLQTERNQSVRQSNVSQCDAHRSRRGRANRHPSLSGHTGQPSGEPLTLSELRCL